VLRRVQRAAAALDRDQRLAALAALGLLATMFLPWYQKSAATAQGGLAQGSLTAFGVFSFVEAAILLVAVGVFALLFARGERKAFHLPGGDGSVIFAAGLWAAALLLWRVFDRPSVAGRGVTVGIEWGFFFAFLAAAALAAAGWRIRAAHRPEPPNPIAEPVASASPRRRARADTAATAVEPRTASTSVAPGDLTLTDPPPYEPPRRDPSPPRRRPPRDQDEDEL
jgi:hypothetical protein